MADVADVSAVDVPGAEEVGIVAALVITIGTPGILNLVRSAHFVDVCAQAIGIRSNANQQVLISTLLQRADYISRAGDSRPERLNHRRGSEQMPFDELVDGMPVAALSVRGTNTVWSGRFCLT